MHDKVFAYIVQSQHNETLECHAFLCTKKKMVSKSVCNHVFGLFAQADLLPDIKSERFLVCYLFILSVT